MNWIRVDVAIGRDASIGDIAKACGVSRPATTGHVVLVYTAMAEGCRDGDLSKVSDSVLEEWAHWRGKRGAFSAALRAYLCTEQGVVRSWDKYNGAKLRELEADKERKRAARDAARAARLSAGRPPDNAKTSAGRPPLRNVTERDGTTNNNNLPDAAASRPKARFPAFTRAQCDAAYAAWLADVGAVDYARFRKAFGPLFAIPEADRPTKLPRDAELVPAIRLFCAAVAGSPEARFLSVEKCAGALAKMADALRSSKTTDEAITAAQWAIGTAQRPLFKVPA